MNDHSVPRYVSFLEPIQNALPFLLYLFQQIELFFLLFSGSFLPFIFNMLPEALDPISEVIDVLMGPQAKIVDPVHDIIIDLSKLFL